MLLTLSNKTNLIRRKLQCSEITIAAGLSLFYCSAVADSAETAMVAAAADAAETATAADADANLNFTFYYYLGRGRVP